MTGKKVLGVGPVGARVFFVGEGPGEQEARIGVPFCGKAGKLLDWLLHKIGLPRAECYITNCVKWHVEHNEDPSPEDIERDRAELEDELKYIHPGLVVTLGAVAARWFLGPDVDMETIHGMPQHDIEVSTFPILPLYHPAAALHQSNILSTVIGDFERLKRYLQGDTAGPVDEWPEPLYMRVKGPGLIYDDGAVGVDTEGYADRPWGLSWAKRPGGAIVTSRVKTIDCHPVVLHNALHDLGVLRALGIDLKPGTYVDTMVMAYLLRDEPQGLKPLAYRHCGMVMQSYMEVLGPASLEIAQDYIIQAYGHVVPQWLHEVGKRGQPLKPKPLPLPDWAKSLERCLCHKDPRRLWGDQKPEVITHVEMLMGGPMRQATLDDIPEKDAVYYSARDADATVRIYPKLLARIRHHGLEGLLQMEMDVLPYIDRMQSCGMMTDQEHTALLGEWIDDQAERLDREIAALVGAPVNASSGDEVAILLFDQLKLPAFKKTRSRARYSTEDKILESLKTLHPVVQLIIDRRELTKIKGTYVDKLPGQLRADGALYPKFRITRVPTGRLSAFDPNVLAIPKHSALGKMVRRSFVARPGKALLSIDLNQIEMRGLAHDSQDEALLAVFREGKVDLHAKTAEFIFGVKPEKQDDSKHRLPAKAVNFGTVMGMTPIGLTEQMRKNGKLNWTDNDSEQALKAWYEGYPGAYRYMREKEAEARRTGEVRDMWSRRHLLPGVHHPVDEQVKEQSLRQTYALCIQGGAQGVVKIWEKAIWDEVLEPLWAEGHYIEPWLQQHDECTFEMDEDLVDRASGMIIAAIPPVLSVPVTGEASHGASWADL
ncbi:hypothetical protein LCGC14_0521220 [marine sediment metagenome]|uniref:Type-4 uracil-DNA glycosylase n=1 Tax=marine sediment metagenome TaxID=412755 RepID=A0A0F9S392_9ZZZZ